MASLRWGLLVGTVTLVLTGCALPWTASQPTVAPTPQTPPAADLTDYYSQQLAWDRCGDHECARLRVPVDYANPGGDSLELAVLRSPATGDRRGSLVVDPGGPGAKGTEYAAAADYIVTPAVADAFDIVGFDPRGVGDSAPVDCLTDQQLDQLTDIDATPDDSAEVAALVDLSAQLGDHCTSEAPGLLRHLSTQDSARDMDVLRAALGQNKLDYLGVSYGTHLGATYAALFPDHVGRFVLDGPLPAALSAEDITLAQAKGFEDALRQFAADCLRHGDCPLGASTDDPSDADVDAALVSLRQLIGSLDATPPVQQDGLAGTTSGPIAGVDPGRPLTEGAAMYAVLMGMYSPDTDWATLSSALTSLRNGDGAPLQTFLNERMRRRADGTYEDNSSEAFYAVSCVDRTTKPAKRGGLADPTAGPGGAQEAAQLAQEWKAVAPTVGDYMAWGNLPCDTWPVPVVPPSLPTSALPPILVVATTHDPATPAEWGPLLVAQLGSAVLLVRDGDGHTAYREGSTCTDEAIDAFLLNGVMPKAGTVCS